MTKARRATPFRIAGRVLGGLVAAAVLIVGAVAFAIHRADAVLRQLLRDYAVNTVRTQSDSVYQLSVEGIHFNWALRHVGVDSAVLTTDTVANARRARPVPIIRVGLYGCTFTGVSLSRVVLGRGLWVRRFGCGVVTVDVAVHPGAVAPPPMPVTPDSGARGPQPLVPFLVLQQGLKLPKSVPRIHVRFIDFPHASFVLSRPRRRGGTSRFALEHLEWHIRDMSIDPDDPLAATRPLFSRSVNLAAGEFTFYPDSVTRIGFSSLRVSVTDSSVHLGEFTFAPTISDAQYARLRSWRRSRVRMTSAAVSASGVDFGQLMRRGGFYLRRLDVDSLDVDVWSDKRLPKNPRPPQHVTPQAWLAESPGGYGLDTISVNGRITYREVQEGHEQAGVLTFNRLRALATSVSHQVGRTTTDDPMTLTASAYLMNTGRLDVTFTVPLDAPDFTMSYAGKLGAMPAEALNGFVERVFPARITGGQVSEIRFRANVRGGVARGELTPIYRDFDIAVTGKGSTGLLARGGDIGRMIRGVASWFANQTRLRGDNPEHENQPPRSAPIDHAWSPNETLTSFVWFSVRDPLLGVIRK